MRSTRKILTLLFLLLATISSVHAAKVLTIYFAGTSFTRYNYFPGPDGVKYPEFVSQLYNDQTSMHKIFIDGVTDKIDPWGSGRTFDTCLDEAKAAFEEFYALESGDLIVNLVGFSRGGVSTMMMASELKNYPDVKVNVLAIDPVPGVPTGNAVRWLNLDLRHVNQFVGIYAEDERTHRFEPILPLLDPNPLKYLLYSLPGAHETLVGSVDTSGHPDDLAGTYLIELRCDYNICRGIAERIFNGPEWGNITFVNALYDEYAPEQRFLDAIQTMNEYENFAYMRGYTFSILGWSGYEAFSHGWPNYIYQKKGYELLAAWTIGFQAPSINNPRLMYRWPYDYSNRKGLADIVFYLNETEFIPHSPPDEYGDGNWTIVPANMPIIESLYGDYGKAYAAWYKMELLQGNPIPDVLNLPPISGECPFILPVPTATDVTDGQMYPLDGVADIASPIKRPGIYTVTWSYTDLDGNTTTQTQEVTATDTTPPNLIHISASRSVLWPANHKMIPIEVRIHATDNCDPSPDISLDSITMTEGDDDDYILVDTYNVMLRSERTGRAAERVYTLHYSATDNSGNVASAHIDIVVPHDQRKNSNRKKK